MPLRAVIFDLDGVLVNTSRFHGQAWGDLVRELGIEPPADLEEQVKGISRMASLKIALGDSVKRFTAQQLDELAERKNRRYLELVTHITPSDLFPGATALFADLKRAGVKILLGSASKNAKGILESLGIVGDFDAIADGFAYTHGKPHPDVFLSAARMAGASPTECIVVEDAAAGITAALDGGFVSVGIGSYESLKHCHLFIQSLRELTAAALSELHARWRADRWTIIRDGAHEAKREDSLQTVFCVGNGRLGLRGRMAELPVGGPQGIYLAGLYETVERPGQDPTKWSSYMNYWGMADLAVGPQMEKCIVNCPNFLDMEWRLEGEKLDLTTGKLLGLQRRLDMRSGIFTAEAHWVSPAGKELRLTMRRFADLSDTRRVFVQYIIEPLNFSGKLDIRAGIDTTTLTGIEIKQAVYDVAGVKTPAGDSVAVHIHGRRDGIDAAFASRLAVLDRPHAKYSSTAVSAVSSTGILPVSSTGVSPVSNTGILPVVQTTVDVTKGQLLYVERTITIADCRREGDPLAAAALALEQSRGVTFNDARIASTACWQEYWDNSDVRIEGSVEDQLGARFSIFHLLIAASRDDDGVSIPAKSLSGDGYRGMVFWDTDIYMTPFFNFTQPALARNLAAFRYRTLDGAREKAARYGNRGASYPWETGVSGKEECEKWLKLITHQHHVTVDVAYAIQQYLDCTQDNEFYEQRAAEVFIETGRFWLSKCVEDGGELSIPQTAGPDELHVVCDDSAFVLNMARWNLGLAQRAVEHLRKHAPQKLDDIRCRTGLSDEDIAAFTSYQPRLRTVQRPDGLFEQCRGFFKLRDEVMDNIWTKDAHCTQTIKQADSLLLFYLLAGQWPADVVRKNYDYYEPRCVHASSLSHAVHGILAAELGMKEKARHYMSRSLGMDLHDEMGNTGAGAHMAANGMNWVAIVRGFGGCWPVGEEFIINPRLPEGWTGLEFRLKWRGADFRVSLTPREVTVYNLASAKAALPATIAGRKLLIQPDGQVAVEY